MLLQLIATQPQAIFDILKNTPLWVWGLLTGLLVLGATQLRDRVAGLPRIVILPIAMTAFSLSGMTGTFAAAGQMPWILLAWAATATCVTLLVAALAPPAGTQWDTTTRRFALPGSVVPMLLILGIFFTRYGVNVELVLQPHLAADAGFAIAISALYGVFNGLFAGRAVRLLRLAFRPSACHPIPA
jgi:hypothetical protein